MALRIVWGFVGVVLIAGGSYTAFLLFGMVQAFGYSNSARVYPSYILCAGAVVIGVWCLRRSRRL